MGGSGDRILNILMTQTVKALCPAVETVLLFVDRYEEQCGKSNEVAALEGLMNSLQISPIA
jgi:septum formation inhibitor-activating ATPase MinD